MMMTRWSPGARSCRRGCGTRPMTSSSSTWWLPFVCGRGELDADRPRSGDGTSGVGDSDKLEFEMVGHFELRGSSDDNDLGTSTSSTHASTTTSRTHCAFASTGPTASGTTATSTAAQRRQLLRGLRGSPTLRRLFLDVGYRWERTNRAGCAAATIGRPTRPSSPPPCGRSRSAGVGDQIRPQQYRHRFVDDEEDEGLREDVRWIFTAAGGFAFRATSRSIRHTATRGALRTIPRRSGTRTPPASGCATPSAVPRSSPESDETMSATRFR